MSLYDRLTEAKKLPTLSDAKMKAMVPLYVEGEDGADHKCEGCSMFIETGACTIVEGKISGPLGVCNFWAPETKGHPTKAQIHPSRMGHENAGYVEAPAGMKVNCESCRYGSGTTCRLWNATVGLGHCCLAWDHPRAT